MTFKNIVTFVVTSFCVLLVTTSCSRRYVYHTPGPRIGHGPPPHAPAHGHRHKHVNGVELVFDSHLDVYVVIGHPDHYYCNGHFYRLTGGVWEMSVRIDGGWTLTHGKPLPPGLRTKVRAAGNGKSGNPDNAVAKGNDKARGQGKAVAMGKGRRKGR